MNPLLVCLGLICLIGQMPLAVAQEKGVGSPQNSPSMFEQVTWKNLSIDFYEVKNNSQSGFRSMTVKSTDEKNGKTFYVSKQPILSLNHTRSMDVSYSPGDEETLRLVIRFNEQGKQTLAEYSTQHQNEMMGVVIDGKLRLVATLLTPLTNGRVQVYGLNPQEAVSIVKRYYQPKLEMARKLNAAQASAAVVTKP